MALPGTGASSTSLRAVALEETYAALGKVLGELPPQASPGLSVLGALKGLWAEARRHAGELNKASGGRAAGEFLADAADKMLKRLLDFSAERARLRAGTPGIALLAMGSYGRREMAPFSDLDILILYSGTGPAESDAKLDQLLGGLLRPLWDAGFILGHAVRTPEECMALMDEGVSGDQALETATALLETRYVAGDSVLANLFLKKDLGEFFKTRGRPFVEAKLQEAEQRRRRFGGSVYRTQPNLKESPGALRDYQLSIWIDRASQLSGYLPRLAGRPLLSSAIIDEARAGYERQMTFRTALHTSCGRKQDVLDFQMQGALAQELGYEGTDELRGSELLLRDYFQSATAVNRLADNVIRRYREERALAERDIESLRRRPLDKTFTRVGDYLYMSRRDAFEGDEWLAETMQAYLYQARLGISLSQEVRAAIGRRLSALNDRSRREPRAAERFLALLNRRAGVGRALRSMRNVGLLGEYLPEFGGIQGLVIHDVVHDFTVDEHTLNVVEYFDRLYASGDPADRMRREILERLERPVVLRLAALFHDVGKSRGGAGHSKRGALMIPPIAERLGLNERDARALAWLVEQHLTFSQTSLRRDTSDPKLVEDLARKIGNRERLDLLYLLTCADISAVGQGSFTHWKDELLRDLYKRLDASFAASTAPGDPGALEAALLAEAPDEPARALVREHLERMPKEYSIEVSPEEARLHLRLLRQLRDEKRPAVAAAHGEGALVDVWVVTSDKAKLFAQITGAFLGAGLNLVSAIAYTRADGFVFDQFRVSLPPDGGVTAEQADAAWWLRVCESIEQSIGGKLNVRERIEAMRRRIPRAPQITRAIEPEVKFDNKLSDRYTVIDIVCGDRIGLLYGLSRALSDMGLNLHFAKVDTNRGLANAVFYVSEMSGEKVVDEEKAHVIRLLLKAVAQEFQSAKR
ncbi:MAG: [protein-PII] uridylyltransferase [Planctomycetota bacterium]|nr:[protein-PII] uridylyltransferase [Planctomycetota bacterium]